MRSLLSNLSLIIGAFIILLGAVGKTEQWKPAVYGWLIVTGYLLTLIALSAPVTIRYTL